jgi:hypothetical protein
MNNEITYWGILCRFCSEPVAFDIRPYRTFERGTAPLRPGAIRCAHGHNYIYFPRDFSFLTSAIPITAATMQENREAYRAINPPSNMSS